MIFGKQQTNWIVFITVITAQSLLVSCSGGNDSPNISSNTFTDHESTLEWASFENPNNTYYSYDEVIEYCDTLDLKGKSDWRMPTADETIDFIMRNTDLYETSYGSTLAISKQLLNFNNIIDPLPGSTYYPGGSHEIVFQQVPVTKYSEYDISRRVYGSVTIFNNNTDDPYDNPDIVSMYSADAERAIDAIYTYEIYDYADQNLWSFTCVRGEHSGARMPAGTWINVENQLKIIGSGQYLHGLEIVDDKHIRLSTVIYDVSHSIGEVHFDGGLKVDRDADYISSGIKDARLKGTITSFAESAVAAPRAMIPTTAKKASVSGVAGIDVILGCINNNDPQYCKEFTIQPATPDKPHNTYDQSTDDSVPNILYVTQDTSGNYTLDNSNPITISTGDVTISLTDSAGNTAVFTVQVSGNDTDVGILNIPDINTLYNFKTSINHDMDYIYHGYNDGETPITYNKTLSICNTGSVNISGTTFTIEVAPEDLALVRNFSHSYNGAPVGFTSNSCEQYNISFEFYRPVEDEEVNFNITIVDNFNALTWKDYTTFRLSQHSPIDIYLASNTQLLEGYLIAPGNQLVRIQFDQYGYGNNVLRVPSFTGSEYSIVLSTSTVAGEDTYMITTTNPPDPTKMNGFTDVYAYEPNDDIDQATPIQLFNGEIISYIRNGDIDFFTLK